MDGITENVIYVEFVDPGAQGEYGFLGKVVARTNVRGMTTPEILDEVSSMRTVLGNHVTALFVEEVGAVGR